MSTTLGSMSNTQVRIQIARMCLHELSKTSDHECALKDATENLDDAVALLREGEQEAAFEKLVLAEEQILSTQD